jgi:hypothetical protein
MVIDSADSVMARKPTGQAPQAPLEERFEFAGDAVAPGDQRALKSALYEVEDHLTAHPAA